MKALEALKTTKEFALEFIKNGLDRRVILGGCDIIEAHLKALEIIKEKEVDIYGIKNSEDVYDYNAGIENENDFENRLLTQEEFDLLKEVVKNDGL